MCPRCTKLDFVRIYLGPAWRSPLEQFFVTWCEKMWAHKELGAAQEQGKSEQWREAVTGKPSENWPKWTLPIEAMPVTMRGRLEIETPTKRIRDYYLN